MINLLQLFEVLAFQVATAPQLIEQALGNGGEQGAGLADRGQCWRFEQLQEGLGRNVFDAGTGAQVPAQPSAQPRVMGAEQCAHVVAMGKVGAGHRGSKVRGRRMSGDPVARS
ncbi:hypothetical protein D3C80_1891100 [compost metagenome]